jgi:integrase
LLSAATRWPPAGGLRARSYATLFGLLAATGLRLSEALRLERRDVDLKHGLLHIRQTKFYKSRYVPLHSTTVRALRRYAKQRDVLAPHSASPTFFLSEAALPVSVHSVQHVFAKLRRKLHWRSRGGHPAPRIHDLRFTFICRRLELWYAQGLDPHRLMLHLFTYVGHVNATSTYWYLNATPGLMSLAARRCQPHAARGAP